ncbi:MAG: glutamate mutase L [Myxococcota bacterium]
MNTNSKPLRSVLATDCGSTTTKAILIEYNEESGEYRLSGRGEAPTTVEAPFEDVTKGVLNSITEVEELRGRKLLDGETILRPQKDNVGVDMYISTSSAGGGLQMMVTGVVKSMTAESATRAALGAGAIVMDVLASNDKIQSYEKIERIRTLRPDMILMAGGTDGGTVTHVVQMGELISAANPKPRLGSTFNLPIIYAGNRKARDEIISILGGKAALQIVENIRPVLEAENLSPARDKIHELFMEHVMAQAPGYKKLMTWTDAPIMPTPGAVGLIIQALARRLQKNVIGVDIGGATTDVFSVFDGVFNRTVSANLGMSYSVCNVLYEAKLSNILRWVPFDLDEEALRNHIANKMIRPTTIPQTMEDLKIEQAIAREALRLAFLQHKEFAVSLKGVQKERDVGDAFDQMATGETIVNMMNLDLLVGSGGVLSHAPRRAQSMKMMIDAFLPEGVTEIAVDSIFMMPHLGVLSTVNESVATEVFEKDCMIRLGACIAPVGKGKPDQPIMHILIEVAGEKPFEAEIKQGELRLLPTSAGKKARLVIIPHRGFDVGAGAGMRLEKELTTGVVGFAIDARGRDPFALPKERRQRIYKLMQWAKDFGEYNDV